MENIRQLLLSPIQEDICIGIKLLSLEKEEDIEKILKMCGDDISDKVGKNKLVIDKEEISDTPSAFVISNNIKFFISGTQIQYPYKGYKYGKDDWPLLNLDENE